MHANFAKNELGMSRASQWDAKTANCDKGSSTAGGKVLSSCVFNTMNRNCGSLHLQMKSKTSWRIQQQYEQHHRWNRKCPYEPKGCQNEIQLQTELCQRSTKLVISTGSTVVLNKSTILWTKLKNFKKWHVNSSETKWKRNCYLSSWTDQYNQSVYSFVTYIFCYL